LVFEEPDGGALLDGTAELELEVKIPLPAVLEV